MAKRLSIEERTQAAVQLASGKSINEVARNLHRSPNTINLLAREPATREQIEALRSEIASDFEDLAKRALTEVTDKKLKKTSAYQNTLIAGIAAQRSSELRDLDPVKAQPKIIINIDFDPRPGKESTHEKTYVEINGDIDD